MQALGLRGMRVALLENGKRSELATLVQRFGGIPYCVPAVQEQPRSCSEEDTAPQVVPEHPKLAAMVEQLAHYASEQRGAA